MSQEVMVYGCGGFGRGIAWLAQAGGSRVVCFIDDVRATQGRLVNGVPVATFLEARRRFPDACVAIAVNDPRARERLASRTREAGLKLATLVHPRVELSPWVQLGEGSIVREGCCFSVNIELGRHVLLNMDCTIGHDVVVGDFASLAPGVHVSGFVHIGRRVEVGTGAVILQGVQGAPLVIGDDAVIGAGACVTKPVHSGVTVVGVPARPMVRTTELAQPRPYPARELESAHRHSRRASLDITEVSDRKVSAARELVAATVAERRRLAAGPESDGDRGIPMEQMVK
jgi:sugar O-acyltransferase (sialic acid O-acetyltransferase NeuD family)